MTYANKYNLLNELDTTGDALKIYDLYVAFSMAQHNNKILVEDFTVASLTGIGVKKIKEVKHLLQDFGYIKYNDEEKQKIINSNNIVANTSMIEVIK